MSTPATATNSSCARCHQTQDQLDEPMKRCTGCRSVLYCSRDCQKLAWKTHKPSCRTIQSGGTPLEQNSRTTMSMNWNDFKNLGTGQASSSIAATDSGESGNDAETIYYLQTSLPHEYDISVSGPYFPLDTIMMQVLHHFGDSCRQGRDTFQSTFIRNGHVLPFDRITSPINNNPNLVKTVRLIREHNPSLAAKLPCPAWVVMQTEMLFDNPAALRSRQSEMSMPIKDLVPRGSFASQDEANARVRMVADELVRVVPGARVIDRSNLVPGVLALAVDNGGSGHAPRRGFSIMASRQ